jgi:BirA family transcriptional regulator, biotin operon repressor / biotin---[acetyl-CoA-carboxylase] ligase
VPLPPEIEAAGYRLIALDATASTNDDALAAARRGDPGRLWVTARRQTAGRGRQGRSWVSPEGNLYASLLLIDPCEPLLAPQLGFVAGVALHETVSDVARGAAPHLALKWPNDLLLGSAKVAGLLLEAHHLSEMRAFALVVGFGVNVSAAPDDTPYPATALRSAAPHLEIETLFSALAHAFAKRLEAWRSAAAGAPADRFTPIRREWMRRAAGLGEPVTVRLPSGERSGRFAGLDPVGRLKLQTASDLELIDAGDLYFPHLRLGLADRSTTLAR